MIIHNCMLLGRKTLGGKVGKYLVVMVVQR